MADKKSISDEIQKALSVLVVDGEYKQAERNKLTETNEYESFLDLMDSIREPRQYSWMSDIRLPQFISHMLTQSSQDAAQYFSTRDFVEVYLEDSSDEAMANAKAAKELINKTLNQKHIYHYQKYIRAKTITNLCGTVYARCWWEQTTKKEHVGYQMKYEPILDDKGKPVLDKSGNQTKKAIKEEKTRTVPVIDRFNWDVFDGRNVFTDNQYVYSIQQKHWIILRSEKTLQEIQAEAKTCGYFNLDKLKDLGGVSKTDTAKKTYDKDKTAGNEAYKPEEKTIFKQFDLLERWGRHWVIIDRKNKADDPIEISPGIDEDGNKLDDAEFIECVITFAIKGTNQILIRFQPNPYKSADGISFKPILRGLCYIHPAEDRGYGDGKNERELQLALDDTFNISNDRVMLATLPTLKVKRYEQEDNPDLYIEPGHHIPLDNPATDLIELIVKDNIAGAMQQIGVIKQMMDQVSAIYPTTMGEIPGQANTTATAVAGSSERSNIRMNYKALTFENTFLTEFYQMILDMTWQFALPETGVKLMGQDKVKDFDATKDYYYKPISNAIEAEYSKQNKIKMWSTILGYVTQVPHPDTVKIVNMILGEIFELMGKEGSNFKKKLLGEGTPIQGQITNQKANGGSPSNQQGTPMTGMEEQARQGAMV